MADLQPIKLAPRSGPVRAAGWLGHPVRLWDTLRTGDPTLENWRMGARAALATALATAVLWAIAQGLHRPFGGLLVGVVMAMFGAIQGNDATPAARRLTLALLPLPSIAGLGVGTLLAPHALASRLALLAVIFAAIGARRWGPRGTSLGAIGFMSYFFALFFSTAPAQLPWMLGSAVVGLAIAWGVGVVLLPDVPRRTLRWSLGTLPVSVALALDTLAAAVQKPDWDARRERRLRRALRRVNAVSLAIENALAATLAAGGGNEHAGATDDLRARVLDIELATGRLATAVRQQALKPLARPERELVAAVLAGARRAVRGFARPGEPAAGTLLAVPGQVSAAVRVPLVQLLDALAAPARGSDSSREPADDAGDRGTAAWPAAALAPGMRLETRQAIQATVAAGLAVLAGHWVSPARWYWAVLGAFIVFIRANTAGMNLLVGWQRILGTAVGVIACLGVAGIAAGHPHVDLAVAFGLVFLGFYLLRASTVGFALVLTLLFADLYVLLGRFSVDVLVVRLEETLVGCALGALVALVVLPTRTGSAVQAQTAGLLVALASTIEEAVCPDCVPTATMREHVRALDRQLRELQDASRPLTGSLPGMRARRQTDEGRLLSAAVFFTRQLVAAHGTPLAAGDGDRHLTAVAARVAQNARTLASAIAPASAGAGPTPGLRPASRLIGEARASFASAPAPITCPASPRAALYWLERIDGAIFLLGERPRSPLGRPAAEQPRPAAEQPRPAAEQTPQAVRAPGDTR